MRRAAILPFVVLVLAACGSHRHSSHLFATTLQHHAPPPASGLLVVTARRVVGKSIIVLRMRGNDIVVRNPHGGALTLRHAGKKVRSGDVISFVGVRTGGSVVVSQLSVVERRTQ